MDSSTDLDKILSLEKEILLLKRKLAPPTGGFGRFWSKSKAVTDALIARWVLIALLGGLFVNWWYGVGFFESIQNIEVTKKSAEYYRLLGDNLFEHGEFRGASDAYGRALKINPNNIAATKGLMRAEVVRPLGEGKKFSPVADEATLNYLRKNVFTVDDYFLFYWEGLLRRTESSSQEDLAVAEGLFRKSIEQAVKEHHDFVPSHFELANTYLLNGKIEAARNTYRDLLVTDPKFFPARGPLGYCQLVLATFESDLAKQKALFAKAQDELYKSGTTVATPETWINLGDAYAYSRQYNAARQSHESALDIINAASKETASRALELTYVFMPESPGPEKTTGPGIQITKLDELKMICLYALAVDYALLDKTGQAEELLKQAALLDPRGDFNPFIVNRTYSLSSVTSPGTGAQRWLAALIDRLCKDRKGCLPNALTAKPKEDAHVRSANHK